MPYIRSFEGYTPPARYDGTAFTQALIRESATELGSYTTIETVALSPVDSDPSAPASRDFTTNDATLAAGWYIIRWADAGGATFDSDPVYYPSSGSSVDLCSLGEVRSFLQKPSGDTGQDAVISSLITRASTAILKDCQREFAPATSAAARTFSYDGSGRMSLAPYDLRSVSQIRMDIDDTYPTTITSDQYRLWPRPAVNGAYLSILFDGTVGGTRNNWRERLVEVTGDWGLAAVPDDVKHAAIVTTAIWLRRDVAAFSSTFNLDEDRVERPEALPSSVRAMLAPYRRHEFA